MDGSNVMAEREAAMLSGCAAAPAQFDPAGWDEIRLARGAGVRTLPSTRSPTSEVAVPGTGAASAETATSRSVSAQRWAACVRPREQA